MKPNVPGRVHAQGLATPRLETAADVVRHLGCVQSQLHDMALWAVARRTPGLTYAEVQAAFARGDFLRTHILRPTWHFVDPADLPWLMALTAPRIRQVMTSSWNALGLSMELIDRGSEVIAAALADGEPHTRAELAEALEGAGLQATGTFLVHQLMNAEIRLLAANGPMQGKQHTYVALPPQPEAPAHDELLAEAARRYARGHGPFRDKDLAWWTSLTLTDSRRAIELAGLRPLDVDGQAYWMIDEPVEAEVPRVMLLSNFDEYISYARDPEDYAGFDGTADDVMRGAGLLMIDGLLCARWSRTVSARTVTIVVDRAPRLTAAVRRALEAEAAAFGRFLNREPQLTLAS
ncbi:winged helix DNA-binding domain-containing protein [Aeromicrobium sp. NPDC092404]|uniref:winged helix DNA-binding domain-containing protein n=1 Tax=Aeromicrobium sp. NPDC092404 TaxID=3154976 RepID=UPI003422E167